MAGYLGDLALGLRQAAGILNPQVQQETFQADTRKEEMATQQRQAQQQFLLSQVAGQIAGGAMTPEAGQAALASKGINIPVGLFGPSADAQAKLGTIKKNQMKDAYLASPEAQTFIAKSDDVGLIRDMVRRGLLPADEALKAMKEAREGDKPISLGGGNGLIPEVDPQTGVKTWKQVRNIRPMVEHNYPVQGGADPQVQPHISHDEGLTWQPVPGTQPTPKYARQLPPVIKIGGGDSPPASPDTLEMDAHRYLTDGTLPPNMGRGVQGAKDAKAIRDRAAQIAKDAGMEPDQIRTAQLTNKAQVSAILQLGKARAQILQYEKLATLSADVALQESDKVNRTQFPVLNKILQSSRVNIAGDPAALRFFDATETFVSEYAKVMGGGYGAGAPTEGAQTRAHQLLNAANTKEQYKQAIDLLKTEMTNRKKSLDAQMDEEKGRLPGGVRPSRGKAPAQMTDDELKKALGG